MTDARLVWLFDIDGTLLLTDGAAREAIALAVRDSLGIEDDLRDIPFAGRTDPLILADILAKHGRALADNEAFWAVAYRYMEELMTPGRGRLLPDGAGGPLTERGGQSLARCHSARPSRQQQVASQMPDTRRAIRPG